MPIIDLYWGDPAGSCTQFPGSNSIAMNWDMGESYNHTPANVEAWMDANWVNDFDTVICPRNRLGTNWQYISDENQNVTAESWGMFILNGFDRLEQDRDDYEALIQAIYDAGREPKFVVGDIEQGWRSHRNHSFDNDAYGPGSATDTILMTDVISWLYTNHPAHMPNIDPDVLLAEPVYGRDNRMACMQQWNAYVDRMFWARYRILFGNKIKEFWPETPICTYDSDEWVYTPIQRGTGGAVSPSGSPEGWGNPVFYLNETHAQDVEHLFNIMDFQRGPSIPWLMGSWRVNDGVPTVCNSVDFNGGDLTPAHPLLTPQVYDDVYNYVRDDPRFPACMFW